MTDTSSSVTVRLSELLREENKDTWEAAAAHRFVRELFAGTLPDQHMANYLVQDYRFADGFMALLGAAVATADTFAPRRRFAQFLGEASGDESTYFVDAMEDLKVHGCGAEERDNIPDTTPTAGFKQLFVDAANTRNYGAIVSVIVVCEWLYLDWATRESNRACAPPVDGAEESEKKEATSARKPGYPARHVHAEWVRLHDYPQFHELIDFLRNEVDRIGASGNSEAVAASRDFFKRTVNLELAFFEAARPS